MRGPSLLHLHLRREQAGMQNESVEAHLGVGRLYPVRPQLALRLRRRGEGAAGGGGPAGGGRREGMRGRLHARLQQLHAHHQRPAHQLPVALQRPLRPVLVLQACRIPSAQGPEKHSCTAAAADL